jgi:hypothetical protein
MCNAYEFGFIVAKNLCLFKIEHQTSTSARVRLHARIGVAADGELFVAHLSSQEETKTLSRVQIAFSVLSLNIA